MEATLQSPSGQTVLEPGEITIGSAPESRVVLHDVKVSPHHAVMYSTEQGYTITDWWSAEGTFVNDQRLEPFVPRLLTAGDRIRIGESLFTFEVHEGTALLAGSSSADEPTVLAASVESTAYGADTQSSTAPPTQMQYGSVPLQEYASTPSQQPGVPMDTKVEPKPLPGEVVHSSKPVMDHCQHCNAELPAGAHFCGQCGFPGINEAGPDEEALRNEASPLTHTPSQQPDVLPVPSGANSVSEAPPPPPPYTPLPPQKKPPPKGRLWQMPRRWRLFALIALIILLVGGSAPLLISWAVSVLPGATATVTVTPMSQHLTRVYAIDAVTGTPKAFQHQVQARLLSFTTKALSKTVKATGQGHQDATWATGPLTFSGATGTEDIPAGTTIAGGSGVTVSFLTDASISPGNTITIKAQVVNVGSGGNIGAYDIDGTYSWNGNSNITVYVQNTSAFIGGQDAYDYTYVQQSDIDGAATPLVNQLTSTAQSAVQQQVLANEQFASAPDCTPTVKSNHKANDRVSDVTVTVTDICKGEVYDEHAAQLMAADLLISDATDQLGAQYVLAGYTVIGTPQVVTTDQSGVVTMNVSAEGVWAYQFSDTQIQTFAQLIGGKPLADAQALLRKQPGVKKVSITTAGGWGSALPTSPNDIKFAVVPVQGLQETP